MSLAPGGALRRRLHVFSPMPPQRNGLADYMVEYLPWLSRDFDVSVVVASDQQEAVARARPADAPWSVIGEAEFLARQPDAQGQVLYNLGNNGDCVYMLDHLQAYPGAVVLHDISLFYLHQLATERGWMGSLMSGWMAEDGHTVPPAFLRRDGSLHHTPGMMYQECLMLARLLRHAPGVLVHTRYAQGRLLGAVPEADRAGWVRIPHFVLPPVVARDAPEARALLARLGIGPQNVLLLVPGFLTGNKMLYEVLAAYRQVQPTAPQLRLVFAGEERPAEYDLSARIAVWWPAGEGPVVTGYLDAAALDTLLARADLSFVLRYPTYGESSGILPRAALGGGRVVTVDIGAYPEFASPRVTPLNVGPGLVDDLARAMAEVARAAPWGPEDRQAHQADEAQRQAGRTPVALYPAWRDWLDLCHTRGRP
ncbi:hypothetical protein [Ideonella oryzae]|uniref:Glycosyltransferase n=1 Tax=Ideonella oryzae TaxID=2937441 RepID=A0ABT1BRV0_9BURK|nr:hypothetical protein [Ideonella oryzae]MCO5978954.1 hypothetical protein [Ideonella oryzae]